jgi:hypothetical protein
MAGVKGAVVAGSAGRNRRAAAGEWESSVEQADAARDRTVRIRIIVVRMETGIERYIDIIRLWA